VKRVLSAFIPALFLFCAAPAAAQSTLGIHGSYTRAADADKWMPGGGVQIRSRFLTFLGSEFLVDYRRDDYVVNGQRVLKVEQIPFQFSLIVYIPLGVLRPYALGGGGYYYTRSTADGPVLVEDTRENKWGGHAGAGLEIQFGPKFFLHADARYVFLNLTSLDDVNAIYHGDRKANYVTAAVGLNFGF
jgi:outer membrane protein W